MLPEDFPARGSGGLPTGHFSKGDRRFWPLLAWSRGTGGSVTGKSQFFLFFCFLALLAEPRIGVNRASGGFPGPGTLPDRPRGLRGGSRRVIFPEEIAGFGPVL